VKGIARRLHRLEDQLTPADRKPLKCSRTIIQKWKRCPTSLENARCKRALCPDGTLSELVELEGSDEDLPFTDQALDNWVASFPVETI